jgi:aminopeptidase N
MNKNAQTADLRRHLEEASGQDLEQFFKQWLFQGGVPTVSTNWWTENGHVHVSLEQTQETYRYEVEVDVQVRFEDDTLSDIVTVTLPHNGEAVSRSIDADGRGRAVDLIMDPNVRLLANFDVEEGR